MGDVLVETIDGSGADLADLDGGSNSEASGASSNSSDLLRRAGGSVITWSAPEFHYHEEDEVTQMDIVRIGDVSTCVEVEYSTKGGSAKTDKDFTSASGLLRFDVGERHKRIFVHITDNVSWGPDVYFFVNLGTPLHFEAGSSEQDRGPGVPGKCCLVTTKVWIVNDDAYPGGCPKTASPEILAMAFFKERIMARGNKVTVTAYCYVYKAAYDVIITTFALIFIFQAAADLEKHTYVTPSTDGLGILRESWERAEIREDHIKVVGSVAVLIIATLIMEKSDYVQLDKRGRSGTRKDLRNWVLQRYIQLGQEAVSHPDVNSGHLFQCMNNHVEEAAVKGWYSLFLITEGVFGMIFTVVIAAFVGGPLMIPPVVASLLVSWIVIKCEEAKNLRLAKHREVVEGEWIDLANETIMQRSLILRYGCQDKAVKDFKVLYEHFYNVHWMSGLLYYSLLAGGPILILLTDTFTVAQFVGLVKLFNGADKYIMLTMTSLQAQASLETPRLLPSVHNMNPHPPSLEPLSHYLKSIQRASIALEDLRIILNLPTRAQETGAFSEGAHEQHYGHGVSFSMRQIFLLIVSMFTHKNPVQVASDEEVDAREARIKRMHDKFHSQLKAVSQSPKALKRRMSFARSHSGGDANTGPPKRRMSFTRGRSKSAPLEGTAMPMSPAATKKSQVAPAANEAWGLSPTVSPVNPVSPVNGESKSNERSKSLVVAHRCAPGTGSTHHWVYHETEMTCFDHIDLRDMGVHIDHDLDPATDPIVVLEKVNVVIPLGSLYMVNGARPQPNRCYGVHGSVAVFFELLCHLRLPDKGAVCIPPHLRLVLLTENTEQFFNVSIKDNLLYGHISPKEVSDATIRKACELASVDTEYVENLDRMCGRAGRNIRPRDRACMMFARAMLSDVDAIVINRTESMLNQAQRSRIYDGLKKWVKGGLGVDLKGRPEVGIPRIRTVFVNNFFASESVPEQADGVLRLGVGPEGASIELEMLT